MKDIKAINEFLKCSTYAIMGVSRNEKKFGNYVYKEMKKRSYNVLPINPFLNTFDGDKCYKSIADAAMHADAVILLVNKEKTFAIIKNAKDLGLKNIWIQQGAETEECIRFCSDNNINLVHGECILMYTAGDKFPHNFHRFLWRTLGLLPK